MLPSNNVRPKRRPLPIRVHVGQREPKRCSLNARYTAAAVAVVAAAAAATTAGRRSAPYRRFGLRWRGRLDATSREYLAPSPRHQPAAAPWPAAVGSYSTCSLSPLPRRHAPGLARSLARSLAQTIAPSRSPRPVASSSVLLSPATSFGVCPRNPRLFPSPFLFLSPFPPLSTVLRRVFGTLLLFRSSSLHAATPGVSRRLDAALR